MRIRTKGLVGKVISTAVTIATVASLFGLSSLPAGAAAPNAGDGAALTGTNQTVKVGRTTPINTITVTDAATAEITAVNDIKIKIKADATTNAIWDTTGLRAVMGGAASAKVSTTVSYADVGKTLVLDVTADFTSSQAVTVSGLSFVGQTGATGAQAITWAIDGAAFGDGTMTLTVAAAAAPTGTLTGTVNTVKVGRSKSINAITITDNATHEITAADN